MPPLPAKLSGNAFHFFSFNRVWAEASDKKVCVLWCVWCMWCGVLCVVCLCGVVWCVCAHAPVSSVTCRRPGVVPWNYRRCSYTCLLASLKISKVSSKSTNFSSELSVTIHVSLEVWIVQRITEPVFPFSSGRMICLYWGCLYRHQHKHHISSALCNCSPWEFSDPLKYGEVLRIPTTELLVGWYSRLLYHNIPRRTPSLPRSGVHWVSSWLLLKWSQCPWSWAGGDAHTA